MILTIDIGNSRIKWVLWQNDEIVVRSATNYEPVRCSDAFDRLHSDIKQLSQKLMPENLISESLMLGKQAPAECFSIDRPSQIFALCVAGDVMKSTLNKWVKQHWQLGVEYLETQKRFKNIINAYADPCQHGVDRWAGIIAACQRYSSAPICVIGAGTAITFDFVQKNGQHPGNFQHMGGYILPSFLTMHDALSTDTANIKSVSDARYQNQSIPNNTNDAVNQGLHKLLQAGIRDLCKHAQDELGESVQIIITGGFAQVILNYPDMPMMKYEPDLVMQGLYNTMKQQKIEAGA